MPVVVMLVALVAVLAAGEVARYRRHHRLTTKDNQ